MPNTYSFTQHYKNINTLTTYTTNKKLILWASRLIDVSRLFGFLEDLKTVIGQLQDVSELEDSESSQNLRLTVILHLVSTMLMEFVAMHVKRPSSSGNTSSIVKVAMPFLYFKSMISDDAIGLPFLVQSFDLERNLCQQPEIQSHLTAISKPKIQTLLLPSLLDEYDDVVMLLHIREEMIGGGAGLIGCSIYLRSKLRNRIMKWMKNITAQIKYGSATLPCIDASTKIYHTIFLNSSAYRQYIYVISIIDVFNIDSNVIENSLHSISRPSLKNLTVGTGLPLKQHRSLQVSRACMTRGRKRNVKLGADSASSCQNV
uniref:Uncharacterized protein n=1 Tax=Glossina palpalis gambiensis TaxID=67801 RepID=A0A1B0C450_9MUSC